MLKANKTTILLLLIFTFAILYRLLLMLWDAYPPGADIGLHNSVIYTITGSGNVNFFSNLYHIGGGLSLTFPGYHIFTASIIFVTGLPEYIAHAVVVSLFSSLIVLCAFLITKRVWSEPAAFIAAFLVAISRFDIEMLLWGGYPNVITLLLIPLTFYFYLQKDRFSIKPFLAITTLLAATIFFTHSLSATIFVAITTIIALFVVLKPKALGSTRKTGLYWLMPLLFGAILIAPFLIQAVPAYLNNNTTLDNTSNDIAANAIKLATLSTRVLPLELVLPLFGALVGFVVFSKKFYSRFIALPTFLLSIWLFVPLTLTLSYLVELAVDFNRFLYFLILPLIIFIAVLIEYGSGFFAGAINKAVTARKSADQKFSRFKPSLTLKKTYSGLIVFFLLICFLALPIFMGPMYLDYEGELPIQKFYQTMNNPGWEALQWIKNNTPKDAVLVSDALYGWWLGGYAQRKTLSAVDPQYLSITEEFEKTRFARYLLDTNYLIDNGYFQVREDGGYISRHNPILLAKIRNEYYRYDFFNFNSDDILVTLRNGDKVELVSLSSLPVIEMYLENNENSASIVTTHGNDLFNFTRTTTVYTGDNSTNMAKYFATMSESIKTDNPLVTFDTLTFVLQTKGTIEPIKGSGNSYIGLIDTGMKTIGHLIFSSVESVPERISWPSANQFSPITLIYNLDTKTNVEFNYSMGVYQYSDNELKSIQDGELTYQALVSRNTETFLGETSKIPPPKTAKSTAPFYVFDYQKDTVAWNVSYIACRDTEKYPKFANDPWFSLVFINGEVAIFKVKG